MTRPPAMPVRRASRPDVEPPAPGGAGKGRGMSAAGVSLLRKLIHVALAWLPALGWAVSWPLELGLAVFLAAISAAVEFARRQWHWVDRLLWRLLPSVFRDWEARRVLGSTWFAIGALAALLAFGRDVGGAAVLFLAWGDPAAEFAGRWWKARRAAQGRPVGARKTPIGSAACLLACLVAAGVGVGRGGLAPWAALAGALTAVAVERWGPPPDDNLWIPLISGLVMWGMQWLI